MNQGYRSAAMELDESRRFLPTRRQRRKARKERQLAAKSNPRLPRLKVKDDGSVVISTRKTRGPRAGKRTYRFVV